MSILGGLLGAGLSFIGGREQRDDTLDAQREQQQFIREGQRQFEGTPTVQTYMPGGARAFESRQALMGLGGDPDSANRAFDNYLGSTDFNFRLGTGTRALTGSRAARGILNSGRTGTALTDFGQRLGSRYIDSYLDRLGQDSDRGLEASRQYGNVITGNASEMAQGALNTGQQLAASTGSMYSGIGEGLGTALGSAGGKSGAGTRLTNRFFG